MARIRQYIATAMTGNQKRFVKKLLIVAIGSRPRVATILKYKYFGLRNLDRLIEPYLSVFPSFFVEIGANDGFTASNTKHFELFHGWHGILIEPIPEQAALCRKYRKKTTLTVETACVGFNFPGKKIKLLYSDTMTTPLEGISDVGDPLKHAELGLQFLGNETKTYEFEACAITMTQVLEDADAPYEIELLSLDVEGGEFEVLNGIDFTRYTFNHILVETRSHELISKYLADLGYKELRKFGEHDFLFRRN